MPNFTFDPKISLGHVITIATLLVTLVVAWQTLSGRVDVVVINDARQDNRLEALANAVGLIRDTVTEQTVDIRYIRAFVEDERRSARTQVGGNP